MKHTLALALTSMGILFSSLTYAKTEQAILAGGCFWCMESDFEKLEGVTDVISGFTGGELKNPTYNGNHQGHYEAVLVTYNTNVLSYQDILNHYWVNIDPFDAKGQFCVELSLSKCLRIRRMVTSTVRSLARSSRPVMCLLIQPSQENNNPTVDLKLENTTINFVE